MIRLYGYSMPADPLEDFTRTSVHGVLVRARGGLDKHYAVVDKAAQLTWPRRLSIASGIASALSYFHNSSATTGGTVFHRDVKSANVVLVSDFTAKLVDCGLAKFIRRTQHGPKRGKASSHAQACASARPATGARPMASLASTTPRAKSTRWAWCWQSCCGPQDGPGRQVLRQGHC